MKILHNLLLGLKEISTKTIFKMNNFVRKCLLVRDNIFGSFRKMSFDADFPDVAAQDLKNPFMEGFLDKKRPSKKYLSVKYQKRWCVIHESTFYYFDRNTDKKQKGAFSLEGYTFIENGNLTFDLKNYGKRTFQFLAANSEDMKRWKKAVKMSSKYKSGPAEKKALGSKLPDPPTSLPSSDIHNRSGSPFSQTNWKQRSEPASRKNRFCKANSGRPPAPEPSQTHTSTGNRAHRRRVPSPENFKSNRQSFDEEDGYIKVLKGQSIPDKACRFSPSLERARPAKSEKRFTGSRKLNNFGDNFDPDEQEISEGKPEDLYLALIGDDTAISGNASFESRNVPNEPIYENTNNTVQKSSTLPAKLDNMTIEDMYTKVNKQNHYSSQSDDESSSGSDTEDYENACIRY